MYFLDDKKLYTNTDYCLDFLCNLKSVSKSNTDSVTLFHTYWYGNFSALQALSIKSFLAMHDLNKVKLCLWLDEENGFSSHLQNTYIKPLLPFITVKKFNPLQEAKNTFLDEQISKNFLLRMRKNNFLRNTKNLAAQSDMFRVLILHKYGGIYFDLDVLFLRDFQILLNCYPLDEFCYAWSAEPHANSAILKINKGSNNSKNLISKSVNAKSFHPARIFPFNDRRIDVLCFPCAFFDPYWLSLDNKCFSKYNYFNECSDFFTAKEIDCSLQQFYPGAFAYHWHNNWSANDIANSYAGVFNMQIDSMLKAKYNIEPNKSFHMVADASGKFKS